MAEIARLRQELGELTERMRTLEATAADKGREVEEARARADEAENGWSASQREVSKLRVELTGAAAERDELLEKLKEADAGRIAALANADALRRVEQLRVEEKERREAEEARAGTEMEPADAAVDSEFGGAGGEAETAVQGAADQLWVAAERAAAKASEEAAEAAAKAAEELAMLRTESSKAHRAAAAAEVRADELESELEVVKAQLADATAVLNSKQAELDGEVSRLSELLIEAKMAAAEHAFERDEAKARAKGLRNELERVLGGGKKVAERATKMEVKYEALRAKYDEDLASLIELRLQSAEDRAKLAEYEQRDAPGRSAPHAEKPSPRSSFKIF